MFQEKKLIVDPVLFGLFKVREIQYGQTDDVRFKRTLDEFITGQCLRKTQGGCRYRIVLPRRLNPRPVPIFRCQPMIDAYFVSPCQKTIETIRPDKQTHVFSVLASHRCRKAWSTWDALMPLPEARTGRLHNSQSRHFLQGQIYMDTLTCSSIIDKITLMQGDGDRRSRCQPGHRIRRMGTPLYGCPIG